MRTQLCWCIGGLYTKLYNTTFSDFFWSLYHSTLSKPWSSGITVFGQHSWHRHHRFKISSINSYYFNYFIVSVCVMRYLIATVGATSQVPLKEPEKIRPCSIHLWLYAKISHCQCMFLNNFLLCLELKYVHSHWNSIHDIKIARRERGTSNVSYLLWSAPESHCYNKNHGFK